MSKESDKLAYPRRAARALENKATVVSGKEGDQCSFCGKHKSEVKRLVAGPSVFICDECIAECSQLIGSDSA